MRETLEAAYPELALGLGGVFSIRQGQAKFHVMPDFSPCPINTNEVSEAIHTISLHYSNINSTFDSPGVLRAGGEPVAEVLHGLGPADGALGVRVAGPRPRPPGGAQPRLGRGRGTGRSVLLHDCAALSNTQPAQVTTTMTPPPTRCTTLATTTWRKHATGAASFVTDRGHSHYRHRDGTVLYLQ